MFFDRSASFLPRSSPASATTVIEVSGIGCTRNSSSEPSSSGLAAYPTLARLRLVNSSVLTMMSAPLGSSRRLALSAAGFIATSTSGASPGVMISWSEKCSWKPETPANVPAGARISAGKSGSVDRSLPNAAVSAVNRSPVSCMPSPESPAKRTMTPSSCRTCLVMRAALLFPRPRWYVVFWALRADRAAGARWPAGLRSDTAIPWSECRCTQRGCESRPTGLCRRWVKVAHVPHCRATNPTCRRRRPLSLGLAIVRELQGDVEVGFAKHGDHRLQVVLLLGAHPQLVSLDLGLHALGPLRPDHLGDLLGVLIRDALVDRHLDPELLAGLAWVGRLDSLE